MKYICVTNIDADTGILCTESPMRTGPSFPAIGFKYAWSDESVWPIECTPEGVYVTAPKFYGTCPDDADVSAVGVLEVLTQEEWMRRKTEELNARELLLNPS
jgi:hypothetical protein